MSTNHKIKRIGILTGGGDCPGLNAVIRAVTKTAITQYELDVFGVEDGFLGLIENRIKPLKFSDVSNILDQGGTILGTSNKADPARFCVDYASDGKPIFENVTDRVVENIKRAQLDVLVCIGGDGTMSAASRVAAHGVPIIGVPKTIDNDLLHTDVTFGFNTAVSIATEAMDRIRTTASSHSRVMLVEMMGRNAGWITLYSGAASGADIILIPEIEFDIEAVCRRCIERSQHGKAYTLVAVSEGAKPKGGQVVVDRVVQESPDPIRLGGVSEVLSHEISQRTKLECRATILGHVQRGGTPTTYDRTMATLFGYHAVGLMMKDKMNHMVVWKNGALGSVPIDQVADKQKLIPLDDTLLAACRATGVSFGDEVS